MVGFNILGLTSQSCVGSRSEGLDQPQISRVGCPWLAWDLDPGVLKVCGLLLQHTCTLAKPGGIASITFEPFPLETLTAGQIIVVYIQVRRACPNFLLDGPCFHIPLPPGKYASRFLIGGHKHTLIGLFSWAGWCVSLQLLWVEFVSRTGCCWGRR